MSVHWLDNQGKNKTIKHTEAYCHCADGNRCGKDYIIGPAKQPKRGNLKARIEGYEKTVKDFRGNAPGFKKPGSMKK